MNVPLRSAQVSAQNEAYIWILDLTRHFYDDLSLC